MKKQELVDTLQQGQDCFFSRNQVVDMLSTIEETTEDTKGKVYFTEQSLYQFLVRFRDAIVEDIESNVSASDLVRDDDCEISVSGREICVEVNTFNIGEIECAASRSVQDFLSNEELFK